MSPFCATGGGGGEGGGENLVLLVPNAREDKGDREGIPHTHPISKVLFLRPQIPMGIRQQPITERECVPRG